MRSSRNLYAFGLLLLASVLWNAPRAAEPKWSKEMYSHTAQDESLRDLLIDFAGASGIKTVISRRISDRVSGRFDSQEPRKFIDRICRAYGLVWYYDGYSLYFYKAGEVRTRIMSLQFIKFPKLAATVKELGIWDERYPLRVARSDDAVFVSGPPRYVEMVIETANRLDGKEMENAPAFSDGQMVKVFPLRYAWAADVTFSQSGSQMTVPGVASLLNSLINKDPLPIRPPWMAQEASASLRGLSPKSDEQVEKEFSPMVMTQGMVRNRTGIFPDARTNSVLIKDTRENLQRYLSLVNSLDVPAGLVELSATIIDVSGLSVRDLGVEWQHAGNSRFAGARLAHEQGQTFSNLTGAEPGKPVPAPAPPDLLEGYTFSTLVTGAGSALLARIRALEKTGKARINSRPAVLTFDNLRANIEHNQTFHVRVAGERDANLFRIESGTILRVTPHIVDEEGEKAVRLVVEIEDGSPSKEGSVDNIPTVNTSVINTQAVVGDEESLLLGGFIRTEESISASQVPLLGSIPLLGHLFKKSTKVRNRVERIFMITPRIIQTAGEAGKIFEEDDRERRFQKDLIPQGGDRGPVIEEPADIPQGWKPQ